MKAVIETINILSRLGSSLCFSVSHGYTYSYSVIPHFIRRNTPPSFNPTIAILLQHRILQQLQSSTIQLPLPCPPCLSKQSCLSTCRRPTKSTLRFSATSATQASCTSSCSREMPTSNMPLSTLLRYVSMPRKPDSVLCFDAKLCH